MGRTLWTVKATKDVDKFDRATIREIHQRIKDVLQETVCKEFGIELADSAVSFSNMEMTKRLKFVVKGTPTPEAEAYTLMQSFRGLPPLNTEKMINGELMRIVGYRTRSRKAPIILERVSDGKQFVCPENMIK